MNSVTQLIESVSKGEQGASSELLAVVYDELYAIAQRRLAHDRTGHTLQTTALVNEAYIRLFGGAANPRWENRAHFFSAAAEAMRRILVDYARRSKAIKRGRDFKKQSFNQASLCNEPLIDEVLEVHEALSMLEEEHPVKHELVKLRYFAGMTIAQSAKVLQISIPTANRYWAFARAWLFDWIRANE